METLSTKKLSQWDERPSGGGGVKRMETLITEDLPKIKPSDPLRVEIPSDFTTVWWKWKYLVMGIRSGYDSNRTHGRKHTVSDLRYPI